MNGQTLVRYLRADKFTKPIPCHFLYRDSHLTINQYPAIVIVNTDNSDGPGIHWCAVYFTNKKICEYFDPLGFPPNNLEQGYNFIPKLLPFCDFIIYNKRAVQTKISAVCGHHCVYFLFLKCRNVSLNNIISDFYMNDTSKNDKTIITFFSTLTT